MSRSDADILREIADYIEQQAVGSDNDPVELRRIADSLDAAADPLADAATLRRAASELEKLAFMSLSDDVRRIAAQLDSDRWHPVKDEGLPKEEGEYLVMLPDKGIWIRNFRMPFHAAADSFWRSCYIAWRPLPNPYTPEKQ